MAAQFEIRQKNLSKARKILVCAEVFVVAAIFFNKIARPGTN